MKRLLLMLLFASGAVAQNQYKTIFPLTQNPISESGHWISGQSAGSNLWADIQTNGVMAFGPQGLNIPNTFGDATAVLTGTWNPNQEAIWQIKIPGTVPSGCCHEVEGRLRTTISALSITGYEVLINVSTGQTYGIQVVRWNGANGQYVIIGGNNGSIAQGHDGDIIKATITGTSPAVIKVYVNGVLATHPGGTGTMTACDNGGATGGSCDGFTYTGPGGAAGPWTSGSPGIGFYDIGDSNQWNLFGISNFYAQDTTAGIFMAATCNKSDVDAIINGGTHVAIDGDIILVPPGTCTWASTLSITKNITIMGDGMPNASASQFGSGTLKTIIVDNIPGAGVIQAQIGFAFGALYRLSMLDISPNGAISLVSPLHIAGTCTASGCPNIRLDNIGLGITTPWTIPNNTSWLIRANNVFGVIDHSSENSLNAPDFLDVELSAYLGVGDYGDNSWAQPDTMGGANNLYVENNALFTKQAYVDTEIKANGSTGFGIGGARYVARFNQLTNNGSFGSFGNHGLDTNGRPQGGRQIEVYGNTGTCIGGPSCGNLAGWRSATGRVFGNTLNRTSTNFYSLVGLNTYRTVYAATSGWGACGGSSAFDTNDGVVYYSGTVTASSGSGTCTAGVSNGTCTMTDSAQSGIWTANQFVPNGAPYTFFDVTKNFWAEIFSNTNTGTLSVRIPIPESSWQPAWVTVGDSYQILRSTVCADQCGRGQGALVSGSPPTPSAALNQALDPVYVWDNVASVLGGTADVGTDTGKIIANRDFYSDNARGNPQVQTSPTSPFNGTTGVGFGTLANRPVTCTSSGGGWGVGYFATDQGSWNTSGNSFGQGQLYVCTATNIWTLKYTPYTYPYVFQSAGTATLGVACPSTCTSFAFANTVVGNTLDSSTFTLTNTGTAALTGLTSTIWLSDITNYQIIANACGSGLSAGASCTFQVRFTPQSIASFPATLTFVTNATNSPTVVNLSGTGTAPQAAIPTFSPTPGIYINPLAVTISSTSLGAIMCYTTSASPAPATDGASGCTTGTLFSGAIPVTGTVNFFAVAGGTGYTDSTVGSGVYLTTPTGTARSVFAKL